MIRRTLITAGALALVAPRAALGAGPKGEVGILTAALELEQLTAYVYDAGIRSGLLDEDLVAVAGTLREHEQQHAAAVASSLEALGGAKPRPPETPEEADALLERVGAHGRLTAAPTREAFFALAHELELLQVALYTAAVGDLEDVRLIQTAASIVAADGAHLVVIRRELGRELVPGALEPDRR